MTSICVGLDELSGPDSALDLAEVLVAYVELLSATSAGALRSHLHTTRKSAFQTTKYMEIYTFPEVEDNWSTWVTWQLTYWNPK